jgi:endoglucanase
VLRLRFCFLAQKFTKAIAGILALSAGLTVAACVITRSSTSDGGVDGSGPGGSTDPCPTETGTGASTGTTGSGSTVSSGTATAVSTERMVSSATATATETSTGTATESTSTGTMTVIATATHTVSTTTTTTTGTGTAMGRALTPQEVVKVMPPGWNLGNSFDGYPNVTSWGNPAPSQTLIDAVRGAGFNTLRLPVTWTNHIGDAPAYTIDPTWMAQVVQTAQWAVDAGMYVFVNTHHDADPGDEPWITFPETCPGAATVAGEVTAVWTQIAKAFASFSSRLMFECFNEPQNANGNDAMTYTDLNTYLDACVNAVRSTGGANAKRIIMIQPVGASPDAFGIQSMQRAAIIRDPNLLISLHTYYPTNFDLSESPYPWGSGSDYASMQASISEQIRVWLPTQPIVIGEWGSTSVQATANRAAHALAYSQDVTTAGMVPIWWDNGGTGNGSYALFNRTTGEETYPTIIGGIMAGVKKGQARPDTWATLANP